MLPITEIREEIKMAILDWIIISVSEKAKSVMNIDIVKPMPASIATPTNCLSLIPKGKAQKPRVTEINENKTIPIGLPKTNPQTIPKLFDEHKPESQSVGIRIHVLANAKSGKIK